MPLKQRFQSPRNQTTQKGELNVEPSLSVVHARVDVFGVFRHFKRNHKNDRISDEETGRVKSYFRDALRRLPSLKTDDQNPLARNVMEKKT